MLCPSRLLWQRALQDRVSQNNTRTARPRPQLARPRPRQDLFLWSQTGLILRPTVSDHITVGFIPGQGLSKQAWVSSVSPTHGSPPCSGPIHWRWRLCVPFPHVTLHAPQADHYYRTEQSRPARRLVVVGVTCAVTWWNTTNYRTFRPLHTFRRTDQLTVS